MGEFLILFRVYSQDFQFFPEELAELQERELAAHKVRFGVILSCYSLFSSCSPFLHSFLVTCAARGLLASADIASGQKASFVAFLSCH